MSKRVAFNVGLIGYGYWGPNLARNFARHQYCRIKRIADIDDRRRQVANASYPDAEIVSDPSQVTKAPDIDIVVIATPVSTHYALTMESIEHGKHVWIEKPMTATSIQAEKIVDLAERKKKVVVVDHTLLFTSAVRKIKMLIDSAELGDIYYYDSVRVNLGLFQHDVNVIWDLAPHDLSIIDHVIAEKPTAIVAHGMDHFGRRLVDVAYVTIYFSNNMIAHLNMNWLSPVKIRRTVIGGQKKMLLWDDLRADDKLRIYDKGVDIINKEGIYDLMVEYRSGDMFAPRIENTEALKEETDYFIKCITDNKKAINDAQAGLRVVKLLEASDTSLN